MMLRKGRIPWTRNNRWASVMCLIGIHYWRTDIYVNNAQVFRYCPNCHQERDMLTRKDSHD